MRSASCIAVAAVANATVSPVHVVNTTDTWSDRLAEVRGATERRVAEYLIRSGSRAASMTAQEIAGAVQTSDATVVRTAKSLGFGNLRELRRALAESDESDLSAQFHATIQDSSGPQSILDAAIERQMDSLRALQRRVPAESFSEACDVLAAADHIWWCGTGPSAYLADYGAFLCRRLGTPSGSLTHAGTDHADELLALESNHAVVLLAYGRIHRYVQVLLSHAAAVGVPVVLVTDVLGPRLSQPVRVRLDAGRGAPALFASHGQTIVLVESLVLAVAAADSVRSELALATLNSLRRALAGTPLDVDPA
jgi:DNA-binding MurR/RpiR family transcriptional regulator